MAKPRRTSKSKKAPRNHFVDYLVTVCVVFFVVVAVGFWYVDDIRVGISVIAETFMKEFFPDALP